MHSIIDILKLNEVRKGVSQKTGKPYEMQDAECLLLTDSGEVDQVGVLQIPKDLMGKVTTGKFIGSFSLRPNLQTRRIEAVLVGLQPYAVRGTSPAAASKAAS
jgi:hypothetical protein